MTAIAKFDRSALLALVQQKKQDLAARNKSSVEKLNDGTTTLRIMGPWSENSVAFFHDFGKHFIKDASGKLLESYICTSKTFGHECPICRAISDARSDTSLPEAVQKAVGDAGASGRVLVNAINPHHPKEPHKVHIYDLPGSVFEQIIQNIASHMELGVDLLGENGRDVVITRTGKGLNTKYIVTVSPVSTPIPAVQEIPDLAKHVDQESAEQRTKTLSALRSVVSGGSAGALPGMGAGTGLPAGLLAGASTPALTGASPTPSPEAAALAQQQAAALAQQQAALLAQQQAQQQAAAQQAALLAQQQQAALLAQQQQAAAQAAAAQQAALAAAAAAPAPVIEQALEDIPDFPMTGTAAPAATPVAPGIAPAVITAPVLGSTGDMGLDEMLATLQIRG